MVFKDITPILADPRLFRQVIDALAERWRGERVQKIIGIESRGFVFAAPLAYALGAGLTIVRKPGKLPWKTISEAYALEYGEAVLEIHEDAFLPGSGCWWSTTCWPPAAPPRRWAASSSGRRPVLVGYSFVVNLAFLGGAARLGEDRVHSLLRF